MMKSDNFGYVYILTNPSFQDSWVKIGQTTDLGSRLRQMNNTSIPLPFEVYATVKTTKYKALEKRMHAIFTDLAKSRINEKREFFNIGPEVAFKHLKQTAELIDDAIINGPDDESEVPSSKLHTYKGTYKVLSDEIFYYSNNDYGIDAKMRVLGGDRYVVLQGSKVRSEITSHHTFVVKVRALNKDRLSENVLIDDVEFSSPSAAGAFVRGGAANGKYLWKNAEGKPLNDFIVYG